MMRHRTKLITVILTVLLGVSCFFGRAQNCTLDIGGAGFEQIVSLFQLNDQQKIVMETLRGELQMTNKVAEEEIRKLFDEHPQSTQEELIQLADKYKVLKQKMVDASWDADKRFLETFNPKQYQLYLDLCLEAIREPIRIVPVMYKDSLSPKE